MSETVLKIRSSPHVTSGSSVEQIMFSVVLALVPVTGFAVYAFGSSAALTLGMAVASCVLFEYLLSRRSGHGHSLADWSAVITGLLFGLTLPPALPLWMVFVGGAICIGLGKHLFGGLGQNPFNPALVGRAVLQATFPVPMTTWVEPMAPGRFSGVVGSSLTAPFSRPVVDVVSSATPLSAWKFEHAATDTGNLAMGLTSGSVGETCAPLILVGGAFLVARGMMNWRITASILFCVAAFSAALHATDPARYASPVFMLLSGGVMLGATFMATDMVGSPMTDRGCWLYGTFIGVLIVVIRTWGGMPEGVMYAILLGNALTPHIDAWLRPRVYGTGLRTAAGKGTP